VDKRLLDTEEFSLERFYHINTEVAAVSDSFSFQGEFFQIFTDSDVEGDPDFWGYYFYASLFLTGEHREYDTSRGIFTGTRPKSYFRFKKEGWGAWEVALRHSYIDLNDKDVSGGEERNFSLGLNWYFTSKTRIMFNYVHARIDHRRSSPLESGYLNILMARFRILF
jgi:phosphate-selective porin OprO/OprP